MCNIACDDVIDVKKYQRVVQNGLQFETAAKSRLRRYHDNSYVLFNKHVTYGPVEIENCPIKVGRIAKIFLEPTSRGRIVLQMTWFSTINVKNGMLRVRGPLTQTEQRFIFLDDIVAENVVCWPDERVSGIHQCTYSCTHTHTRAHRRTNML